MAVQLLEVFCCLMDIFAVGAGASAIPALGESKGPVSLANNQRSNKCQFADCRSLTFRSTDYCWKHQDGKPHESDGPLKPNAGDSFWWENKEE
tara:strand:- start:367 stop:645 length:279 start_codon:yes stop_codon:yes gene_type:complete